MFDLVLRLAGAQSLGQIVPVFEEPRVQHHEDAADVARTFFIEIKRARRGVAILRFGSVAVALEKLHRHQRVEKIANRARVQREFLPEFCAGQVAVGEFGEKPKLHRGQEHFGRPETEGGLQDGVRREVWIWLRHGSKINQNCIVLKAFPGRRAAARCAADESQRNASP